MINMIFVVLSFVNTSKMHVPVSEGGHPAYLVVVNDMEEAALVLVSLPVVPLLTLRTAVENRLAAGAGNTAAFLQPLEAEIAVGLREGAEQGGDVGGVHHQHVAWADLLLGHHVATLGLGELDINSSRQMRIFLVLAVAQFGRRLPRLGI